MKTYKRAHSIGLAGLLFVGGLTVLGVAQEPAPPPNETPGGMPPGGPPPGMPPGMPPGEMPPGMPPGGMPFMLSTADTDYTAAVYIENGEYDAARSVSKRVKAGDVSPSAAEGLRIESETDDFNGVFVRGESSIFELSDATIRLNGDGSNDFLGLGAGVMAEGGATVIVRNADISMRGVVAAATVSTGDAVMRVYDSTLHAHGGELPEDFVPVIGPGMKTPPAPLGITGTARTNVTMGNAKSYFYNSTIIAEGWGALSTDACGGDVYLEANNSNIVVNNSGYGLYSDNGCRVVFNDTTIKSATYGGILAGVAYAELNNVRVDAAKNVLMVHSVMGRPSESARAVVKGGKLKSGEASFLIKSANIVLDVDGADLQPGDGDLIHAIVNDDSFATKVNGAATPGINVTLKNMTLVGDIRHQDATDRNMTVSLVNTQLTGAIVGAEVALDDDSSWTATGDSQVSLARPDDFVRVDARPGVTIQVHSDEATAAAHKHRLASGGELVVNSGRLAARAGE